MIKAYLTFALAALAGTLTLSAHPADREGNGNGTLANPPDRSSPPPVLRRSEPADSVMVTLPGPRVRSTPPPVADRGRPEPPDQLTAPERTGFRTNAIASVVKPAGSHPGAKLLAKAELRAVFPPDFQKDSAVYCQQRIGQWTKSDAYNLLGEPLRERPAYAEDHSENGRIFAFSDPTGRYRALEMDFAETGLLRTVFVYPWSMTWVQCRQLWGAQVTAAAANNGRTFYSYQNRRLDVLVDPVGKVVSLGFY